MSAIKVDWYTSGHDYLDAERASCLMNTHWNTVWRNRPSSTENSTFPGLRFEPQSRQFHVSRSEVRIPVKAVSCFQVWGSNPSQGSFLWCDSNDNSYSSIDKVVQTNILHWLTVAESWEKKKIEKMIFTGDSNPRPGNVELEMELEHTASQWVCIKQLVLFASR